MCWELSIADLCCIVCESIDSTAETTNRSTCREDNGRSTKKRVRVSPDLASALPQNPQTELDTKDGEDAIMLEYVARNNETPTQIAKQVSEWYTPSVRLSSCFSFELNSVFL